MSLADLTKLVEKTDNKTELRISVSSGGRLRMDLDRQVKGNNPRPLVTPMSTALNMQSIDELADEFILDLAAQQLGLKNRF